MLYLLRSKITYYAKATFCNSLTSNILMDEDRKSYICYQCREIIHIPSDWIGDKYALLEVHYLLKHDIDIRNINWKRPMTIHRILDLEMERIRGEESPA
jgi:hypothetical protein